MLNNVKATDVNRAIEEMLKYRCGLFGIIYTLFNMHIKIVSVSNDWKNVVIVHYKKEKEKKQE